MTKLIEVWEKGSAHYKTPICGTPLFQKSEIVEWLKQNQTEFDDEFYMAVERLLEDLKNE